MPIRAAARRFAVPLHRKVRRQLADRRIDTKGGFTMPQARHILLTTAALVATGAAAPTTAQATQTTIVAFRIPAQSVQGAMAQFAQQSGVQILFPYDHVQGLRTKAIHGRMTADDAISRMIAGTGLKIARSNGMIALTAMTRDRPVGGSDRA
eukprot:gene21621-22540_t